MKRGNYHSRPCRFQRLRNTLKAKSAPEAATAKIRLKSRDTALKMRIIDDSISLETDYCRSRSRSNWAERKPDATDLCSMRLYSLIGIDRITFRWKRTDRVGISPDAAPFRALVPSPIPGQVGGVCGG
jgi:hypothetical protein